MGSASARRVRRTKKQWQEVLRQLEASGLSVREFCKREGLSASSVQRWRSRLGRAAKPQFLELTSPSASAVKPTSTGWSLELELPGGLALRLQG